MKWMNRLTGLGAALLTLAVLASVHAAAPQSNSLTGFTGTSLQPTTQAAVAAAGFSFFSTDGPLFSTNDNGTPLDPSDDFQQQDSNDAITFDAGGTHFGALYAGDGGRNYMRTLESDYATVSFTAGITLEVTNNDQASWFGLGAGDRALFGTPDWATQLSSASFWPEPGNDKITAFRTQNDVNAFVDKPVPGFEPGVHRLQMTFNSANRFLVGSIDLNYAGGPFVADATTLPIVTTSLFAADGWPSEPSRIFFGGDDGATFRDFEVSVVPEPASAMLLAAGGLILLRRRRNRR